MQTLINKVIPTQKEKSFNHFWRRQLIKQLKKIQWGSIVIEDSEGLNTFGKKETGDLKAKITVANTNFYQAAALGGSVGIAESYMHGDWNVDDLVKLVRIMVRNRDVLDNLEGGIAWLSNAMMKFWHYKNRNTVYGSRRNIAAHYDLGNEFFAQFLDQRMMYSSAIFETDQATLQEAADKKLQRICEGLALNANDHVLEIGSGWGGFAIYAAKAYGCKVTTTTISNEQYQEAAARIKQEGLQDRITLLKQDYRTLTGKYDKCVSIEMVEAVGAPFLPVYFKKCSDLLKENGLMLLQAITIEDTRYQQALTSVDFIKRYIFPGSFIPCVSVLTKTSANTGLRLMNLTDIGVSYALTLRHWRQAFLVNIETIRKQGYDEVFIRMWLFYLCYCEGGFLERSISDVQMLFAKSASRRTEWLG